MLQNECSLDYVTTAYVVHKSKVLLIFHKKLRLWLPPGGHIEREETPDDCAIREVREETGLSIKLIDAQQESNHQLSTRIYPLKQPLAIQIEDIEEYHQHVDLIYVGMADSFELSLEENEIEIAHWCDSMDLDKEIVTGNVRTHGKQAIKLVELFEKRTGRQSNDTHI